MSKVLAITNGLLGAGAVTLLNEIARRSINNAPRLDVMGENALAKLFRAFHRRPPRQAKLFKLAMVGDIVANSLYYSLVGSGKGSNRWQRGALLGLGAGIGAILLPPAIGLSRKPVARTKSTKLMTIGWYLAGGLAAAAAANARKS